MSTLAYLSIAPSTIKASPPHSSSMAALSVVLNTISRSKSRSCQSSGGVTL